MATEVHLLNGDKLSVSEEATQVRNAWDASGANGGLLTLTQATGDREVSIPREAIAYWREAPALGRIGQL